MDQEEIKRIQELLVEVLWCVENTINFHGKEDYADGFPSLRTALSEVRTLMYALVPPPVLYMVPLESVPEPSNSLVLQVRSGTEGRTVSTVQFATAPLHELG